MSDPECHLPSTNNRPNSEVIREHGEQPLAKLMAEHDLRAADLVAASEEQITHKMVARACKGRRLTSRTMAKVHRAWQQASGRVLPETELFNYRP